MVPAITHFLVGAAILLSIAAPIAMRYDVDREHAIWLVPLRGIWGLAPDVHHIAPIYAETLYALHNSPWADLFGLHYTLDRPTVRARYYVSVFGAIVAVSLATRTFWSAGRIRRLGLMARRSRGRAVSVGLAMVLATLFAALALWVAVSVRGGFASVAGIVGRRGTLVGGVLMIGAGAALGMVWTALLEVGRLGSVGSPRAMAGAGGVIGIGIWAVGIGGVLPLVVGCSVPLVHLGALGALCVYGTVFGVVYGVARGAFATDSEQSWG